MGLKQIGLLGAKTRARFIKQEHLNFLLENNSVGFFCGGPYLAAAIESGRGCFNQWIGGRIVMKRKEMILAAGGSICIISLAFLHLWLVHPHRSPRGMGFN